MAHRAAARLPVYTGYDGATLLHHSQWKSELDFDPFVHVHGRSGSTRSTWPCPLWSGWGSAGTGTTAAASRGRSPGCRCMVIVEIRVRGAGPETGSGRGRTRSSRLWRDRERDQHPGGISAHFHLSTDGTRVLNYAEWETAQAHIDALTAPGDGVGSATREWERVQTYPGLKRSVVTRYTHALGLVPA